MEDNFDRSPVKFTPRRISRRSFLKGIRDAALLAGGAAVVGGALWKNRDKFEEFEDSHSVERLIGKPIPGEDIGDYVTQKYGDNDLILVRKHPYLSDGEILGYTDAGQEVKAQPVYGVPYPSFNEELGGPIMVNDEGYGKWFEIDGKALVVYDSDRKIIETSGKKVYIAGNFLPPDKQEAEKTPDAR